MIVQKMLVHMLEKRPYIYFNYVSDFIMSFWLKVKEKELNFIPLLNLIRKYKHVKLNNNNLLNTWGNLNNR